ncbi:hypothetical protein BDV29DRAFT_170696 [Aspergillus leporis]|uniref:Uncharacterized protein n=1 Tax=Aspergillus leporis TaxID=41062 RepID=A0A5N5XAD7_9EURO|nr:hypothetical protein BDV29DRAFT_170696 [Aspergillus leporis]
MERCMVGPRVKGTFSHPAILIAWPSFQDPGVREWRHRQMYFFFIYYLFFFPSQRAFKKINYGMF